MYIAYYETPLGLMQINYNENCLYGLKFVKEEVSDLNESQRTPFTDRICQEICEYISGQRQSFDIDFKLSGSEFQQRVWQELLKIPYGHKRSYGQIAEQLGNLKLSRAVGMACGKNPIWIIVPCHRVIGANGKLTGYGGGLKLKAQLISLEKL